MAAEEPLKIRLCRSPIAVNRESGGVFQPVDFAASGLRQT